MRSQLLGKVSGVATSQKNKQTNKQSPGAKRHRMWGYFNVKYVALDHAEGIGCMGCYLDKGKAPNSDDPDGLPTLGINTNGCLAHGLD